MQHTQSNTTGNRIVERNLLGSKHFEVCVVYPELAVVGRAVALVPRDLVQDSQVSRLELLSCENILGRFQKLQLLVFLHLALLFKLFVFQKLICCLTKALFDHLAFTGPVIIQARELILFEVRHEVALVLAKHDLGEEVGDAQELDKLEEVCLLGQLLLRQLMSSKALLTPLVAHSLLQAALEAA